MCSGVFGKQNPYICIKHFFFLVTADFFKGLVKSPNPQLTVPLNNGCVGIIDKVFEVFFGLKKHFFVSFADVDIGMRAEHSGRISLRIPFNNFAQRQNPFPVTICCSLPEFDAVFIKESFQIIFMVFMAPVTVVRMHSFYPGFISLLKFFWIVAQHGGIGVAYDSLARNDIKIEEALICRINGKA